MVLLDVLLVLSGFAIGVVFIVVLAIRRGWM
jgi:hypothetical protein